MRRLCPATLTGSASIRTKAKTAGAEPVSTQACIVPRCTTTSPCLRCATVRHRPVRGRIRPRQDRVVHGLGAVHELGCARRELGDPDDGALARADVIVALDETLALRGLGRVGIVHRHPVGGPDLAAVRCRRVRGRRLPVRRSSVCTMALPLASWPVTMRRTSKLIFPPLLGFANPNRPCQRPSCPARFLPRQRQGE